MQSYFKEIKEKSFVGQHYIIYRAWSLLSLMACRMQQGMHIPGEVSGNGARAALVGFADSGAIWRS